MDLFVCATIAVGAAICATILQRAHDRGEQERTMEKVVARLAHYTGR